MYICTHKNNRHQDQKMQLNFSRPYMHQKIILYLLYMYALSPSSTQNNYYWCTHESTCSTHDAGRPA